MSPYFHLSYFIWLCRLTGTHLGYKKVFHLRWQNVRQSWCLDWNPICRGIHVFVFVFIKWAFSKRFSCRIVENLWGKLLLHCIPSQTPKGPVAPVPMPSSRQVWYRKYWRRLWEIDLRAHYLLCSRFYAWRCNAPNLLFCRQLSQLTSNNNVHNNRVTIIVKYKL